MTHQWLNRLVLLAATAARGLGALIPRPPKLSTHLPTDGHRDHYGFGFSDARVLHIIHVRSEDRAVEALRSLCCSEANYEVQILGPLYAASPTALRAYRGAAHKGAKRFGLTICGRCFYFGLAVGV